MSFLRTLLSLLKPRPPPVPRKARPARWDGAATVTRTTVQRLEWLERESGTSQPSVVLCAVRCFSRLPSDSRQHLVWQQLQGIRGHAVAMPKEALAILSGLRVAKSWSVAQLASTALDWFAGQPLAWCLQQSRREGEKP